MTSTETAASAMTWMMAARMLLSRCAAAVRMFVLFEGDAWSLAAEMRRMRGEGVRLGDLVG